MNKNRINGRFGESVVSDIYEAKGYFVEWPEDPYSWYDFVAKQEYIGATEEVFVQVETPSHHPALTYNIKHQKIRSQIAAVRRRLTPGFSVYHVCVVSLRYRKVFVFGYKYIADLVDAFDEISAGKPIPGMIELEFMSATFEYPLTDDQIQRLCKSINVIDPNQSLF